MRQEGATAIKSFEGQMRRYRYLVFQEFLMPISKYSLATGLGYY